MPPETGEFVGVRVGPRVALLRNGLLSVVAAGIPLFGVLYWFAYANNAWVIVAIAQVVYLGFVLFGVMRWRAGFIEVSDELVTKQAFLKRTVVRREDVAAILIARTDDGSGTDSLPQLVATQAQGAVLFRLRGLYWDLADMHAVADAIGCPVTEDLEPLTLREFYERIPGAAYWYEGRSWLAISAIFAVFAATVVLIGWVLHTLGVPGVFTMDG